MTKNHGTYKTKSLTLKKLGWKRIAKNTQRFGWVLDDAVEHTTITETTTYEGRISGDTIYINPKTHRKSKVRVWLSFYRTISVGASVGFLEFIYNVLFLIRRILAFCLPIFAVGMLIVMLCGEADLCLKLMPWLMGSFFSWIGCIIFEGVFARIAAKILRNRDSVKKPASNKKSNVSNYAFNPSEDDVITLKSKNGEEIDFVETAGIFYNGNSYAILQPLELLEGMKDNEALVFKVTRGSNGKDNFEVELDEKIIDAVFAEYNRLLDEAEGKYSA